MLQIDELGYAYSPADDLEDTRLLESGAESDLPAAEDRLGDVATHSLGVVVMLDSDATEERMIMVGAVARGVHAGDGGAAPGVHEDPVVEVHRGVHQRIQVGFDPRSHHRELALDSAPAPGDHVLQHTVALESDRAVRGQQLHALLAMDRAENGADLSAQDSLERRLLAEHGGHAQPQLAQ